MNIFMPGSLFRFFLDFGSMVLIIYFSISVMFRMAFQMNDENQIVVVDIIADLFFVTNFYLRSSYFAFTCNGSICTERILTWKQYMKGGVVLGAVSYLSVLDVFAPSLQLWLLSLLRIFRLPSYVEKVREHLSLRGIRISLATNLLGRVILYYTIANHWVACIWFIIHR